MAVNIGEQIAIRTKDNDQEPIKPRYESDLKTYPIGLRVRGREANQALDLIDELSDIAKSEYGHARQISHARLYTALVSMLDEGRIKKEKVIERMMKMSGDL